MDSCRIYSGLFLAGKVEEHLLMVQKRAEQRLDVLVEQTAAAEGVTERLRAADQMLCLCNIVIYTPEKDKTSRNSNHFVLY